MLKKFVPVLCATLLISASFSVSATTELVKQAKAENSVQRAHNVQRESGFKQSEQQLQQQKAQLVAQLNNLQKEADKLAKEFSKNEDSLARLEEKLRLETGSLGELFGVVRQNAKEIQVDLSDSVTGIDRQTHTAVINDIVAAKSLPSMKQLTALWHAMNEQIHASDEIATLDIELIDGDGRIQNVSATRIGAFGLISEQGYLQWSNARQDAVAYSVQPNNVPTTAVLNGIADGEVSSILLDPSNGVLLEQLALTPTIEQRLEAGGVVGKIIISLLILGLIIAFYRGVSLAIARQKIAKQLKMPQQPGNNPLGRVLAVHDKEKNLNVEALELRLLEVVVDEQTVLEKGLSMLKLLAALAPMLGLLGTVTGMIETFQVITQFGNGDPKVMAGGISMALVTTVLGLVAAMPLLLAHNILSSQAENIRNILEKQGIGLVAEQAERESHESNAVNASNAA